MSKGCSDRTRNRHVLEEFVERAVWDEHGTMYAPPFRDRLPDGSLGPDHACFDYDGEERSNAQWDEARADYALRPFWDREREGAGTVRRPRRHPNDREDAPLIDAWMRNHSHQVPRRELEVYTLFYCDHCTRAHTAQMLGITIATLRNHLKSLRHRIANH